MGKIEEDFEKIEQNVLCVTVRKRKEESKLQSSYTYI